MRFIWSHGPVSAEQVREGLAAGLERPEKIAVGVLRQLLDRFCGGADADLRFRRFLKIPAADSGRSVTSSTCAPCLSHRESGLQV